MKRTLSWLFGVLAYFGPPVWAALAIEADRKSQLAGHGWVCGNPMIGIMLLAGISSGFLSLIATGFSVASFRSLPRPQSKGRVAELGVFILPLMISIGFIALILLGYNSMERMEASRLAQSQFIHQGRLASTAHAGRSGRDGDCAFRRSFYQNRQVI